MADELPAKEIGFVGWERRGKMWSELEDFQWHCFALERGRWGLAWEWGEVRTGMGFGEDRRKDLFCHGKG